MKALLINPHKLLPVSFSLTQRSSPPLGLAYIAGAIEKQGYEVTVFDCTAEGIDNFLPFGGDADISVWGIGFGQMLDILSDQYDLIGMTVMFSNNWLINRQLLNLLKYRFPKALIVIGGEHASAVPEYCLKDCEGLDMVVRGEGEETISEVAIVLKEGKSWYEINGTVYKIRERNNQIKRAPVRKRIRDVNDIELPAWHLFPLQKYFENDLSWGVAYGRSLPVFATRGCPYECTFCSSPQMWGTKYSMRDVENVIDEIKHFNKTYAITNFDFYDLTAIINKRWILDFCNAIKREDLNITWQIPGGTRSEAITYEVSVALRQSGCRNITYAPESGSIRVLHAIGKKVNISRMLTSIDGSFKAGLNIKLNVMMGFPDEKLIDILKTYLFLIKASYYGAMDAAPSMFSPYPGSVIYEELLRKNELVLSDKYFKGMVYTQSQHKFINYNRHLSKSAMMMMMFLGYVIFYGSNYLFRPLRAIRLFINVYTRNYQTRGEYMVGEIMKRNRLIRKAN